MILFKGNPPELVEFVKGILAYISTVSDTDEEFLENLANYIAKLSSISDAAVLESMSSGEITSFVDELLSGIQKKDSN